MATPDPTFKNIKPAAAPRPPAPISNGCGPGWLPSWTWPNAGFEAECAEHDSLYTVGGTRANRYSADSVFYVHMSKRAAESKPGPMRIVRSFLAPVNHLFVRIGGWASFKYRKASLRNSENSDSKSPDGTI